MTDEPKTLDVRVAELESAVKKLTDSMTPMAAGQGVAVGATCGHGPLCQICILCVMVCMVHPVGMTCAVGGMRQPICNECTCGPCAQ